MPITYVQERLLKIQQSKYLQPARPPQFRVSSLPYCPLIHLKEIAEFTQEPDKIEFRAGHYFRVGHAVHDNYQTTAITALPSEVVGDYSCDRVIKQEEKDGCTITHKCNRLIKFCTPNEALKHPCPHRFNDCSAFMRYSELEFKYRGISGHCDFLLREPAGSFTKKVGKKTKIARKYKWHVADFKTTGDSLFKNYAWCVKSGHYPSKKYIEQIETYCVFIEHFHNIEISTYTIAYVSRDRPQHNSKNKALEPFTYAWTPERRKYRRKRMAYYFNAYGLLQAFLKSRSKADLSALVENRPCKSPSDYKKYMEFHFYNETCPLYDKCTGCKEKEIKVELWNKAKEIK